MVHFGQLDRAALQSLEGRLPFTADPRELESAREVQARLFPRHTPQLSTLECAAFSAPAKSVGGDYYDFLSGASDRVGLAIGDVSGKGVPAALMMAVLHASLRAHYASGAGDLRSRLESVNRLFVETTAVGHYATLFVAEYEDASRRLRYANCGHLPPVLVRADGRLERLAPNATVLGAFEHWNCGVDEVRLDPGDTLIAYTDGVTEASNETGDLYGDQRLVDAIGGNIHLSIDALITRLVEDVHRFAGSPADDLTVLALRARRTTCGEEQP